MDKCKYSRVKEKTQLSKSIFMITAWVDYGSACRYGAIGIFHKFSRAGQNVGGAKGQTQLRPNIQEPHTQGCVRITQPWVFVKIVKNQGLLKIVCTNSSYHLFIIILPICFVNIDSNRSNFSIFNSLSLCIHNMVTAQINVFL